jgi:hypothetical protein
MLFKYVAKQKMDSPVGSTPKGKWMRDQNISAGRRKRTLAITFERSICVAPVGDALTQYIFSWVTINFQADQICPLTSEPVLH